jgi:O-antigen/teichoic acid export membrane protein
MSARKSLIYSVMDRYASLAISIGSSMLIARLLTPTEIGIFSVTMVMLVMLTTVRDMGAGSYLIQVQDLTAERVRAVWSVQLGLGIGLACIILAISYPAALLYHEPRVQSILLVVALNYAINPFGSITYAWLMREMKFETVAVMRFCSSLGGALVSGVLAWKQYGPISLAFGSLAATAINALIASYFRPAWFPLRPGLVGIREVLAFGSRLTGSTIATSVSGSAVELILGKLQGLAAAGFYSRAGGLLQMFNRFFVDAVGSVCLPWFSKQLREVGSFTQSFEKATSYATVIGWPFCIGIFFLAHPTIRLLYGTQWDASVNLARLLAIGLALSVPSVLCNIAMLASGAVAKIARLSLVCAVFSFVVLSLGAMHSLLGLGVGSIAASAFSSIVWMASTRTALQLPLARLGAALWRSLLVALASAIGPITAFVVYGFTPDQIAAPLALGIGGSLLGFIIGAFLARHPIIGEFSLVWKKLGAGRA